MSGLLLQRIKPPRGPRNDLWVVLVTTSAKGTGLGYKPAAIKPATCAISTTKYAPTLSAMSLNFCQSQMREYAEKPAMINLGLCSSAKASTCS